MAGLLSAVLARLAPLLEEHRRPPAVLEPGVEPGSWRGAAEPAGRRVESRPHVPRRSELRAFRSDARDRPPEAPVRAVDALRHPARTARRRARARGGAEARASHLPARARLVLPGGDRRAAGGTPRPRAPDAAASVAAACPRSAPSPPARRR